MNPQVVAVFSCCIALAAATPTPAQSARQSPAIASSDVPSQISMFSYLEGPKSDLVFRGAPIAVPWFRRAIAVRDYLISQRVPASSIDVAGLCSARPVAANATADGRARNRRVELVLAGGPLAESGGLRAAR